MLMSCGLSRGCPVGCPVMMMMTMMMTMVMMMKMTVMMMMTVQEATSGFAGCRSSEEEEEEKEESETASQQGDQWRKRLRLRPGATAPSPVTAPACMLCDDDTHIPRPCLGCPVVMCMERWEQQSGLTEVLCTRCFQETDKEELRRMAEAGDEDAEQLLRKKEEEEEKDKKEGAAAAEDAEQEHSD
jgi:hypothetical protein